MLKRAFFLLSFCFLLFAPAFAEGDSRRQCLMADAPAAKKIATWITEVRRGECKVDCDGCGCKGGPGYEVKDTGQCVSWDRLTIECGPPPHTDKCIAECVQAVVSCKVPEEFISPLEKRWINWPGVGLSVPPINFPNLGED